MSGRRNDVAKPTLNLFEDEFGPYLDEAKQDPAFRAAFEDAEELHKILDSLVELRRTLGLSQTVVAERMGVRQPTVSGFETEGSDPRLSTLQRYARAVKARLRLILTVPADCDWASNSTAAYGASHAIGSGAASVRPSHLPREWRHADKGRDNEWAATA